MSTIVAVNWSDFLGPDPPIAHDVTFIVNEEKCKISANKFVLAAVSPVLREVLYQDTSFDDNEQLKHDTKTEITISHTTVDAVKAMLQYVYASDPLFSVESIEHLHHIFHTLTLAHKYEILGLVDTLQSKLSSSPLTPSNVKEVAHCAAKFGQHGMDLLSRCLNLSYNQSILTTLVDLGKQTNNHGLVAGALARLKCRVTEENLWSMERLADLKDFSSNKGEEEVFQASRDLLARCVEKLADLMRFRKKFARITSSLSKEDDQSYRNLMRLLDELFCENCKSANCQGGKNVDEEVERGTKVKLSSDEKGEVVGVGSFVKKIKLEDKESACSSSDTSPPEKDVSFLTIRLCCCSDAVYPLTDIFYDCT